MYNKKPSVGTVLSRSFALTIASLAFASAAQAEIAVIVNKSVAASQVSTEVVSDIFLGKVNTLPDGTRLTPVDQEANQSARTEFYAKVVKKDDAQLNAYWSRLIFTGKGEPPKKLADNAEVIALVKSNAGTVGYVDASAVNDSVKVLLRVP